jgi:putative nucleotidyltransferase with HDIG domain
MKGTQSSGSIFSQSLDRAILVMFFLGAIIPLIALATVMNRFVFPVLLDDSGMTQTLLGVLLGVSTLTLASFFALRRLAKNAIGQMNADNARLQGILSASKDLSTSFHVQEVVEIAAKCARTMTGAKVTLILMRASDEKPLTLVASNGKGAQELFQSQTDLVHELVESCLANESMTELTSRASSGAVKKGSSSSVNSALAFPLLSDDRSAGAVVVLNGPAENGGLTGAARDALTTLTTPTGVALRNVNLHDAQRNFFTHITELLVSAMDAHVDERKGHARAVAQLSNRLARELALPEPKMQRLHFAALLHDIGMLRIDTADQRSPAHFKKHPQMANRILARIRLWEDVAPIVLHHHEWFDGSGYPKAISGEEIPFESRIIAVADTYDALSRPSERRSEMTSEEAVREISDHSGTQFDPRVTAALERLAENGILTSSTD